MMIIMAYKIIEGTVLSSLLARKFNFNYLQ